MKILILEDDENRIQKFKELFIGCDLRITHLAEQANKWIEEEEFDYIFLDHDLEEDHYKTWQDPSIKYDNTGLKTAKFLGENPHLCINADIFIHSLNPYGRESMKQAMKDRDVQVIPFTSLVDGLRINI